MDDFNCISNAIPQNLSQQHQPQQQPQHDLEFCPVSNTSFNLNLDLALSGELDQEDNHSNHNSTHSLHTQMLTHMHSHTQTHLQMHKQDMDSPFNFFTPHLTTKTPSQNTQMQLPHDLVFENTDPHYNQETKTDFHSFHQQNNFFDHFSDHHLDIHSPDSPSATTILNITSNLDPSYNILASALVSNTHPSPDIAVQSSTTTTFTSIHSTLQRRQSISTYFPHSPNTQLNATCASINNEKQYSTASRSNNQDYSVALTTSLSATASLSPLISTGSQCLNNNAFNRPLFNLENEVKSIVRLAHRSKDINIADVKDPEKSKYLKAKILKKIIKSESNISSSSLTLASSSKIKKQQLSNATLEKTKTTIAKTIGRPLTATTKVRLTLVPSLPTLYSMLATEPAESFIKQTTTYKDLRGKFHILKRGKLLDFQIADELKHDNTVDWRFKTVSSTELSSQPSTPNSTTSSYKSMCTEVGGSLSANTSVVATPAGGTPAALGGSFPGRYQTVVFVDSENQLPRLPTTPLFPSAIGLDSEGFPMYKDIDIAIQEIFGLREYTLLRVTRAAAFEKTGAIVLKMETLKPGDLWIDDDEFDLRLMYKLFSSNGQDESLNQSLNVDRPSFKSNITTTFLKKKIARPRYKSNMRIYLIPRNSNIVIYTRESMLRRDIVNGTINLHDQADPRLIITSFNYNNLLKELNVI